MPSRLHRSLTVTSRRNPSSTIRIFSSRVYLRRVAVLTLRTEDLVSSVRSSAPSALAQIHRRDDYAAAERAIGAREGDGPGTIWGRGGPVSVFSCRGETL